MTLVALLVDKEQRVADDPELMSGRALRHAPMEYHLARTLRALGYVVTIIPCISGRQLIASLTVRKPDVVFNATEKMDGRRANDMQIPALLDLLHLPYTGATAASLLLNRDKATSKSIASIAGVRVPRFALVPPGDTIPPALPPFPLLVKPVWRDSSEGVSLSGIARTPRALARRVELVHRRYREPAIVESYIEGTDIYVTAVEDGALHILPPLEMRSDGASIASYHVKHNNRYRKRWNIRYAPAALTPTQSQQLQHDVRRLWPALQFRDYARIDFRLSSGGELYFIEGNPNPGFSPVSRCTSWKDVDFPTAVGMIVGNAMRRG